MARASSVVSARAMALDNLTQPEPKPQLADFCSAPMAGFYAAVDTADGLNHLDAYDAVVKSDLGGAILRHREEASRFIESQPAQD